MGESLVIVSKVADVVKAHNKSMSKDFTDKLTVEVKTLIDKAIQRASDNGRQTVMAKDV